MPFKVRFGTLWTWENSSTHWGRCHGRICFPRPAPNDSPHGEDPLWSHDGSGMLTTSRGTDLSPPSPQVWKEVRPVSLVTSVIQEGELGPEVTKSKSSSPGDQRSES